MKPKLGDTRVKAISDGGLSLYPKPTSSDHKPILCIEVLFPLPSPRSIRLSPSLPVVIV